MTSINIKVVSGIFMSWVLPVRWNTAWERGIVRSSERLRKDQGHLLVVHYEFTIFFRHFKNFILMDFQNNPLKYVKWSHFPDDIKSDP